MATKPKAEQHDERYGPNNISTTQLHKATKEKYGPPNIDARLTMSSEAMAAPGLSAA